MYSFLHNKRRELDCPQEAEAFVTDQGQQAIRTIIHFSELADEGIYYITMAPCEDAVSLLSGAYTTDVEKEDVNPWNWYLASALSREKNF